MFAERYRDHEPQVRSGNELVCTFCENKTGPHDRSTFLFGQGVGTSMGVCCGECAHRMGVSGTVDVCPFCLLPILSKPKTSSRDEDYVLCDHCIELFQRLGLE